MSGVGVRRGERLPERLPGTAIWWGRPAPRRGRQHGVHGSAAPCLAPRHSEATPRPQAEDEAERYLLVLRFLEGSPCTAAFEALKREAVEHGLLGSRTDWTGASRPTSYERELDRRAPNLPSEHLAQLLDMVQRLSREREPVATRLSAAPGSLLRQGTLSLVEPSAAPLAGPRALASRSEELPRTSLAWSARLSPAVPLPEMLRRGDPRPNLNPRPNPGPYRPNPSPNCSTKF